MLLIITGSTPPHSCLSNFPKWPLPSLAGMVTFYPDSKHRTSVNPSAAPRLSHVRRDGKREEEKEEKKQVPEPVKLLVPMDRLWSFPFGTIWWGFGVLYPMTFSTSVCQKCISEYIPMKWITSNNDVDQFQTVKLNFWGKKLLACSCSLEFFFNQTH